MGQEPPSHNEQIGQRIKPAPGASGLRVRRKNTISIYSERTPSIHMVKVDFDMKLDTLKLMFPGDNIQFLLDDEVIPTDCTLRELGITEKSLLKIVYQKSHLPVALLKKHRESITNNCFLDVNTGRMIGPKQVEQSKPVQPVVDSFVDNSTAAEDQTTDFNFHAFAVPDLQVLQKMK